MANFVQTYFWESGDAEGWSEHFYHQAANIATSQAAMDSLIPLLCALRDDYCNMIYARVSDVTVRGDSLASTLSFPQPGTYTIPVGEHDLEANSAILVQLFATSLLKNHWFLRGLTTSKIKGRSLVPETTWDTNFAAVASVLQGGTYSVRHRTSLGPPPTYSYTSIVTATDERATARKPGRPFGLLRGRIRR